MERITADLLIPGRGDPVPDGVVVLDGGRISYAGPAAGALRNAVEPRRDPASQIERHHGAILRGSLAP